MPTPFAGPHLLITFKFLAENRAIGDLVKERREMGAVVEVKSSARAHKAPLSDHKNKQRHAPKHNYTISLREVTTSRAFRRSRDLNGQLVSRVYLTDSACHPQDRNFRRGNFKPRNEFEVRVCANKL